MSKVKIYPVVVAGILGFALMSVFGFNPMLAANPEQDMAVEQTTEQHVDPSVDSSDAVPQIVGGREAARGAYPFIAMLTNVDSDHLSCGASLIDEEWVLTAAHCVDDRDQVDVVLGRHDQRETDEGTRVTSQAIYIHPEFGLGRWHSNDIALIHLSRPVTQYEPAAVARDEALYAPGEIVTMLGWGADESGSGSSVLREIDLPILSNPDCNQSGSFGYDVIMCFGHKEGRGTGAGCNGDSGSPAVIRRGGEFIQIGVHNGSWECVRRSASNRVNKFAEWIDAHIDGNPPYPPIEEGSFRRIVDQYEPNSGRLTATTLLTETDYVEQYHTISGSDDEDWFTFTLTRQTRMETQVYASSINYVSLDITLINDDLNTTDQYYLYGNRVSETFGSSCNWADNSVLPAGTYYIRVREEYGRSAAYSISQTRFNCPQPDQYEPNGYYDEASAITYGETQVHTLISEYDDDWMTFTLSETTDVVIETNGYGSIDTRVSLHEQIEQNGNVFYSYIIGNGFSGFENHGRLQFCGANALPAGTYAIEVEEDFPGYTGEDENGYPVYYDTTYFGSGFEYTISLTDCSQLYEPNDSSADATPIRFGESQTHTVDFEGDVDWFTFVLTETTRMMLIGNNTINYDQQALHLYNENLDEIENIPIVSGADVNNDLRWSDFIMLCGQDALPAGTYYLSAEPNYSSYERNEYRLSLSDCYDAAEPNDEPDSATALTSGEVYTHSLAVVGDVDWFAFTLPTTGTIEIDLRSYGGSPISATLYFEGESIHNESDWNNIYIAYCNESTVPPGVYTLRIEDGYTKTTPFYSVKMDECFDTAEPNNSAEDASPLTMDELVAQQFHTDDDEDWFVFTVDGETAFQPVVQNINQWIDISFYDSDLNVIRDGVPYYNYCDWMPLEAGTYYIRATAGALLSHYTLGLMTTCEPPDEYELYLDEYERDDYYDSATPMVVGEWQSHSISSYWNNDWMSFTVEEESDVTISVESAGDMELTLSYLVTQLYTDTSVYDGEVYTYTSSYLQTIEYNDDFYGTNPHIRACDLAPGDYYITANEYLQNELVPEYRIKFEYASCNRLYLPAIVGE